MGLYQFRLPDIGEGIAEAEIVAWHIQLGDRVKEDQCLVEVMTDKATVEMTSPIDGKVIAVHGAIGEMLAVGSVLFELEVAGEGNVSVDPITSPVAPQPISPPSAAPKPSPALADHNTVEVILAAPATRSRANALGIALQHVRATGPGGRVTPEDLENYVSSNGAATVSGDPRYATREAVAETRIIGVRRKIAEKIQEAKRRVPHIGYVEECDLTELEALRKDLNANRKEGQPKLTLLPFFIRALAKALPDFPQINANFDDEVGILREFAGVHVGIATQTSAGLIVPVIHHAETLDVWACADELTRLSKAARDGTATRGNCLARPSP